MAYINQRILTMTISFLRIGMIFEIMTSHLNYDTFLIYNAVTSQYKFKMASF